MIPDAVKSYLSDPLFLRVHNKGVDDALGYLEAHPDSDFARFYKCFSGPFASGKLGYELLDLLEQSTNIVSQTNSCRELFDFPKNFFVLTDLVGNSVLVYEAIDNKVYDVDFEGGDELLMSGNLKPVCESFSDFLSFFFSG